MMARVVGSSQMWNLASGDILANSRLDQAPVPEPPAFGGLGHSLAAAFDEFAAVMIVTAPERIPTMGKSRPSKQACRREYRPALENHSGQAFPEDLGPRLTSSILILGRRAEGVQPCLSGKSGVYRQTYSSVWR